VTDETNAGPPDELDQIQDSLFLKSLIVRRFWENSLNLK
jgi:hypothetical protein